MRALGARTGHVISSPTNSPAKQVIVSVNSAWACDLIVDALFTDPQLPSGSTAAEFTDPQLPSQAVPFVVSASTWPAGCLVSNGYTGDESCMHSIRLTFPYCIAAEHSRHAGSRRGHRATVPALLLVATTVHTREVGPREFGFQPNSVQLFDDRMFVEVKAVMSGVSFVIRFLGTPNG